MDRVSNQNIFFLIPTLETGGAERQVSYLQKAFIDSKIICFYKTKSTYELDNDRIFYLSRSISTSKLFKLILFPIIVFNLYKYLKAFNSKVTLISFMEYSNFVSFFLSAFLSINSIYSVRNTISKHYLHKSFIFLLIHKLSVFVYKRAGVIVTNSLGAKNDLVNYGVNAKNIHVINNMYDVEYLIKKANTSILTNEIVDLFLTPTLLSVGRLEYQKGHEHLVQVIGKLKENTTNIKLLLVGEGSIKKNLIGIANSLKLKVYDWEKDNLNNNYDIYFMGNISNPYYFYKMCTIFALPSLYEGFPNVLIEAGICGAACISTNCQSGPSELFINQTLEDISVPYYTPSGVLMPTFDGGISIEILHNQWAEVIIDLLKNDNLYLNIKNSLKLKANNYSIENTTKAWSELIN